MRLFWKVIAEDKAYGTERVVAERTGRARGVATHSPGAASQA